MKQRTITAKLIEVFIKAIGNSINTIDYYLQTIKNYHQSIAANLETMVINTETMADYNDNTQVLTCDLYQGSIRNEKIPLEECEGDFFILHIENHETLFQSSLQ